MTDAENQSLLKTTETTETTEITHDRLFKELLTMFFAEFIALFAPEMYKVMDTDNITFLDKEILPIGKKRVHIADIVAKVRYQDRDAFFLILNENQGYPDANFGERFFMYWMGLHLKYEYPVYPIVVFSYDRPLRPEPSKHEVNFPGLDDNAAQARRW